jgi:hypothetical protein
MAESIKPWLYPSRHSITLMRRSAHRHDGAHHQPGISVHRAAWGRTNPRDREL